MKNADDIKKIFDKSVIETDANQDKKILEKMTAAFNQTHKAQPERGGLHIGRIIMGSKLIRFAAAACIITAVVIGINYLVGPLSITSVGWADVVEKVKSVSFLNATFYLRDKTSSETFQVDLWLGSEGRERIKTREQIIFAKNGRIIFGFNYVKKEKIDKEQIDRFAQIVIDMLEDSESFSLDTVVQKMSNGVLKEITPLINQEAVISEDVIVFDLTSEQYNQWLRIWALRESKLPIRILAWNPDNGQYADVIFNYSQKQSAAFFDPDEYQKFLNNSDNILGDSETNLAYALYKEPVGKNYVPSDGYRKYRNTEDLRTLKEHLSDKKLVEYYKAHPLEEGQMDFRKGQMREGLTISAIQGLENYKIWRIGTTVNFFARGYQVPSYGRMRFDGDFNDIFLQYDIVGCGEIPYQKYVEAVLSRVGLEIIESEDLCTVWIAEYNGQELKPASSIKIPLPNAPAGTPGALAGYPMSSDIKFFLRSLARDQDVVVEDNTGIDKDKQLSDVIPNFKTEVGAELAKEWYLKNFGITFRIEQRKMAVWIIRKKQ